MASNNDKMSQLDKLNLACGVIAILLLGAAMVIGYLPATVKAPEGLRNLLQWGGYGFMAAYVLTLLWLKRKDIGKAAETRQAKSGANSTVQIVAVLAILTAVNWYGNRHHVRLDMTENKAYSLADQSVKVVKDLKEPVNVTVFVKKGEPYQDNLVKLWEQYAYHGGDKVALEVVDVDKNPTRARMLDVKTVPTTVLARGERKTTITGTQEQDLTSALLKVTQNEQKVVYFVTGHGELGVDKMDPRTGLSNAKEALEKQNYRVQTISLFGKDGVPADAAMVVIPGPEKPFLAEEVADLRQYLDKGGRVFISLRPQASYPNLEALAKDYGIAVNNDIVVDPRGLTPDLATPVVQQFPNHAITQNLNTAFFTAARSLKRVEPLPKDVHVTPLVESDANAWGETGFTERQLSFNPERDHKGPVPLMLLGEKGEGKLIVSGNALFMANESYFQVNNGDLFLNAANWMADNENLIAIPPKDSAPKTVELLPWQYTGVFYGTVIFLPLGLLAAAAFVWWRRR